MGVKNTSDSWGWPARILHWVMALMIVAMIVSGSYASNLLEIGTTDAITEAFGIIQTHKSFGFTVFVLALIRVVWRLANPTPALPPHMPGWQRAASHVSHWALYGLIIAVPVSGWLMASASPLNDQGAYVYVANMVFGLFEMPDPYPTGSEALSEAFHTVHFLLSLSLAGLLLLHIGAALKHHVIDRDTVLKRMSFGA